MNKPEASADNLQNLLSLIKSDAKDSFGFGKDSWKLLLVANILAVSIAAFMNISGDLFSWAGLVLLALTEIVLFLKIEKFGIRLLISIFYLAIFVFWVPLTSFGSEATEMLGGHGDLFCFLRGLAVSMLMLLIVGAVTVGKRIGPTRELAVTMSLIAGAAGVLSQAWFCSGVHLAHAALAHGSVVFTSFVMGQILFKGLEQRWLKNSKSQLK